MVTAEGPEPGFYPDPDGSGRLRWWDGEAWTKRHLKRTPTPRIELRVGGRAKVVATDDAHHGQTGTVDALDDDKSGIEVYLRFANDPDVYAYRRDEVVVIDNTGRRDDEVQRLARADEPEITTPKPEPGFYPDPDGSGRLRWWDGNEWTTRHSQRPGEETTPSSPTLKVGDRVQVVSAEDKYDGMVGSVEKITNDPHGYNIHVSFNNSSHQPAFREDQLKASRAGHADDDNPRVGIKQSAAKSTPARVQPALSVGTHVRVVDRDDRYDGRIGVVRKIGGVEHSYEVLVAFDDGSLRGCRRDRLTLVDPAPHQPPLVGRPSRPGLNAVGYPQAISYHPLQGGPPQKPSFAYRQASEGSDQRGKFVKWWRGLSDTGKAILILSVIASLFLFFTLVWLGSFLFQSEDYRDCVSEQKAETRSALGRVDSEMKAAIEQYCERNYGKYVWS